MTAKIVHIISIHPRESNMLFQEKMRILKSMSNESMGHHYTKLTFFG